MKYYAISALFFTLLMSGCKDGASELDKNAQKAIRTFNLLDQNAEIPAECKPPVSTEENKRAFVKLRGRINRCAHFIPEYPELNNVVEVRDCLNQIGDYFDLVPDQVCKDLVIVPGAQGNIVDVMNTFIQNFYIAKVRIVTGNETSFNWDEVENYFTLWAHWFNQTRQSMYPLGDEEVISSAHAKEFEESIHRPFWNDMQLYSDEWRNTFGEIVKEIEPTNPDGSPRTPEEIIALRLDKNSNFQIFKTMLGVNQRIIDLAYNSELASDETFWTSSSSQKRPSPLLASLVGNALSPFFERMQVITKIYDVSCKLKQCNESFYENNKTFWIIKYFYSLANNETLSSLDIDSESTDELDQFILSLDNHKSEISDLVSAISEAFEISDISLAIPGSDFPEFLNSFYEVFAQSHDFIKSYNNTKYVDENGISKAGYFSSGKISEINVGFSKANMDRHIQNVKNSNEKLSQLRQTFNQQKHTLIQEVLAINSSEINLDQLEDRINIDLTEMIAANNQINAVRSFISDSRIRFADEIKSIIENQSTSDQHFFQHPVQNIVVKAEDTSTGNPGVIDGTILANIDQSHNFVKGDVLQINVSGQWSPTCAASQVYGSNVVGSQTSSRGFTIAQSNGEAFVQSVDKYAMKESYSDFSQTVSACVGAQAEQQTPIPGLKLTASVNACANSTTGTRRANGTRTSSNSSVTTRSDASFNLGLTAPNTPYSNLPAGSLLFVTMPRGENIRVNYHNIHLLNGNDTIIVDDSNLDFYLIGNDCSSPSNTGELAVSITRQSPQGALAQDFVDKVGGIVSEVQSRVQGLISSGQLSHQVLTSIRSQLLGQIGVDINSFNGPMRQLLDSLISNEIAILDFKSQLTNMERNLETKKQQIYSLIDQFGAETEQKYLRVHTRNWLLSNMDLDFVNQAGVNKNLYTLNKILNTLEHSLVSYLDFKYRNSERDLILGDLTLLSDIDISDNFDKISENITTYVSVLLDNLEQELNNRPLVPQTTVAIRVPNPYYQPSFPDAFPDINLHPKLEASRAQAFWDKLIDWNRNSEALVDFDVLVDDLYTNNGLSCYTQTPIIETFGLFFIPENEGYVTDFNNNYKYKNAKLFLNGPSIVPFENLPRTYNFVDLKWRYLDAAIRMAISPNDAMRMLVSEFPPNYEVETGLGSGRPLFANFQIGDLPAYSKDGDDVFIGYTPLSEIKELVVAYVISASNSDFNVNLNWINHCSN